MKKLLFIAMLSVSTLGFSQLTKSVVAKSLRSAKVAPMGLFVMQVDEYSDHASIMFNNANNQEIVDVQTFILNLENYKDLRNLLLSNANKENDVYELPINDDKVLHIRFVKGFGVLYPQLYTQDKAGTVARIQYLTSNQLNKLFGA